MKRDCTLSQRSKTVKEYIVDKMKSVYTPLRPASKDVPRIKVTIC